MGGKLIMKQIVYLITALLIFVIGVFIGRFVLEGEQPMPPDGYVDLSFAPEDFRESLKDKEHVIFLSSMTFGEMDVEENTPSTKRAILLL